MKVFLLQVWFENNWPWGDNWVLCDQLAMLVAINKKSILKSSQHLATVELQGALTRGMIVLEQRIECIGKQRNVTLIKKTGPENFKGILV